MAKILRGCHVVTAAVAVVLLLVATGCSSNPVSSRGAGDAPDGFAACPDPVDSPAQEENSGAGDPDRRLPELSLRCMDGSGAMFPLRRSLGVPLVINLWGSWCAPCGKELPAFAELDKAAAGKVVVMGVVIEDSAARADEAAQELGVTFPNLYDRSGALRRALGVNALPVTLFVDADGELRELYAGPILDAATLRQKVGRQFRVEVGAGR
ncbi:MAG: TlpA family protein disulfide reductase [Mycobacteriales bacterium]